MESLRKLIEYIKTETPNYDFYGRDNDDINERIDETNKRIDFIRNFRFLDEITVYLTIYVGNGFSKEEKFGISDYTFFNKDDGKVFWAFAYLDYSIYWLDEKENEKYSEEELKIINDCEEIINTFLHKNHLLSKDLDLTNIGSTIIYIDETEISFKKVFKNSNRLDLAKKVNETFKNNENKD